MKKVNILLGLFLISLTGCDSTEYMDYADTQIAIESAEARFPAIGGQKEFTIDVSDSYTVTSDQNWCKATANGKTITVNVEPNRTISGRTALLTIRSENKVNYIPVTQTSAVILLDNYTYDVSDEKDTILIKYECDFPVKVVLPVDWISSSVDPEKKEITLIVEEEKNIPRSAIVQLHADGGNNSILTIKEINIRQNFLTYDDFIGSYTMRYSKSTSVTTPSSSLSVSLAACVQGTSYFLKGILADDDIGKLIVLYNDLTGSLSVTGCKVISTQDANAADVWWAPYQRSGSSYYVTPTDAYGMKSVNHNISNKLTFDLVDDGLDPGYTTIGFILRKYTGTTSMGNVNGKDEQPVYYYPIFEKK
jgi:hypothetical protein